MKRQRPNTTEAEALRHLREALESVLEQSRWEDCGNIGLYVPWNAVEPLLLIIRIVEAARAAGGGTL